MAWLGDLLVRLRADTADFVSDLGKASRIAETETRKINRALGTIGAGVSIAGVAVFARSIIDLADDTGKLSQKVAISTETLSGWRLAAELGNVEAHAFSTGMRDFNRSLVEASDSSSKAGRLFKALGVDVTAGPEKAFRQFAEAFSKLPESELRTAVAMEVLKKAGAEWIPVLAEGSKGLDDAADKAKKLGLVISEDFSKKAAKFNDDLKLLGKSSQALGISLLGEAIEGMTFFTNKILEGALAGEKWLTIFREVAKLGGMTLGKVPGVIGMAGRALADAGFNAEPIKGSSLEHPITGKIGGLPAAPPTPAPDPEAVRKALVAQENYLALQKRQIAAVQQMEEKQKSLNGLNEEELMTLRVLTGTYADFDSNTKVRLLNMAIEMDVRKQTIDRIEKQAEAITHLYNVAAQLDSARLAQRNADQQQLADLALQNELIGKNAYQQEKLNALRQIDVETRRRMLEVAELLNDTEDGGYAQTKKILAQGEEQKRRVLESLDERIRKERDWTTGARVGLQEYMDATTHAANLARGLWTRTFQSLEDALVDFVKTGKLNFRSLADSIITELIRIHIKQSVMTPLVGTAEKPGLLTQGLNSLGKALFGALPGFASGGAPAPNSWNVVGERGPELAYFGSGGGTVLPNSIFNKTGGSNVMIDAHRTSNVGGSSFQIDATRTMVDASRSQSSTVSVVQNIHVGGNVTQADIPAILAAAKAGAVKAVAELRRRNPTGAMA